jgi:hypothetical protein
MVVVSDEGGAAAVTAAGGAWTNSIATVVSAKGTGGVLRWIRQKVALNTSPCVSIDADSALACRRLAPANEERPSRARAGSVAFPPLAAVIVPYW